MLRHKKDRVLIDSVFFAYVKQFTFAAMFRWFPDWGIVFEI